MILLISFGSAAQQSTIPTTATIESGKFRYYETKQLRGQETYTIDRASDGTLNVKAIAEMPFAEQEKKPLVIAKLALKNDFSPLSFEVKGPTFLEIEENTSVVIQGRTAIVEDRGTRGTAKLPSNFFTLSGYVPLTIEMMLIRYWLAHGRPTSISLLPVVSTQRQTEVYRTSEAFVELRGKDTINVSGKPTSLSRYHLHGKNWRGGWGRQTLWFDARDQLVAAINLGNDVETNIYAFREPYESQTSFFLKRAAEDSIAALTDLANKLSPKASGPIALVGGTLIDGTGKPPVPNSAVLLVGDRITAVGPRSTVKIPDNARVIDITGKYLIPGLWDMHSHFYSAEFGPTYLAAGITTARDVGNDIEYGTMFRDSAKEGRGLGPRMFLAGYIDGKSDSHGFDVEVETPEEARAAVQRYKNAGYEQIKIRDNVKLETLKIICEEAHKLGMTVTGHVPKSMNVIQAVEAGMDQISHLNYVVPGFFPNRDPNELPIQVNLNAPSIKNALEFFKKNGTAMDPTLAVLELMIRPMSTPIETFEPGVSKVAPELVVQINKKGEGEAPPEALRMVLDVWLKLIGALHKAGVPIVAGSDVGVPGFTLHRELELYVKAGFTPLEAIQSATLIPAQVMKVENEVGTIETGKRADVIVLEANPLENISNTRKVRCVVTQGRFFESAKLWESVGFKP